MADSGNQEQRGAERQLLQTEVTFHTGDDIYMANSVDISDAGIRIVSRFKRKTNWFNMMHSWYGPNLKMMAPWNMV